VSYGGALPCLYLLYNLSTLRLTSTRMNTMIPLPITCQLGAAVTTSPGSVQGWLCLSGRPQHSCFSIAIPRCKRSQLHFFVNRNTFHTNTIRCLIFSFVLNVCAGRTHHQLVLCTEDKISKKQ